MLKYELINDYKEYAVVGYNNATNTVEIPETHRGKKVTSIGDGVFSNRHWLVSITIPGSVTNIGDSAFKGCYSLKDVYYNGSLENWLNIDFEAFNSNPMSCAKNFYLNNKLVAEIVIPNAITEIKPYVFCGFNSIVIPNSITSIGDSAFKDWEALTSVTIPDSVTSVGEGAFEGCRSLKSVIIPDSVTTIRGGAFYNCKSLRIVVIPDSVTSIGNYAFYRCEYLTGITIPNGVRTVGGCMFYECLNLTRVTIPDSVTALGNFAFRNCKSLTNITIPDSVTEIGRGAFCDCKSLKTKKANYKAFKIVDGELKCWDTVYKENEPTTVNRDIYPTLWGIHYCTNLFEIFNYYSGMLDEDLVIYECEVLGDVKTTDTSLCCTNSLKPVKRLSKQEIIDILNKRRNKYEKI